MKALNIRRSIISLTSLLSHLTTTQKNPNSKLFSTHSKLKSTRVKPLMKWPLPPPELHHPPKQPTTPLNSPQPQNLTTPNYCPTTFTTLCDLLSDPTIPPGPILENALDKAGIFEVNEPLFLQLFTHFDSSPKPLFTLYLWAEKKEWFKFSVTVFNAMVNALGKGREFDSAWNLILDRLSSIERPNVDTFAIMIRRYARAGMLLPAIRTYEFSSNLDFIHALGFENNLFEILLDSLSKEGHVRVASEYFYRRKGQDTNWSPSIRAYNILLNGWFRSRKLKKAERLWAEMKKEGIKPNVVTYGTLVEGLCRICRVEMAIELIGEMKEEGIEPNAVVYNPIIDAFGEAGRFKEASGMMERLSVLESGPTLSTYNSLVKGFCKAGDLIGASKILKMMINRGFMPTATTYNYFFRYFSKFGKIEEGLNLYTKMIESGYVADRLTYHLLVKMLCEQDRLDLAMQIIQEMRAKGFDLDLATSTMLIHLFCKMHRFDDAIEWFRDMIRRGLVPQYLTYQRMCNDLKKQGMTEKVQKLRDMMVSTPHSEKLPNTYIEDGDSSHTRRKSIIEKADKMSDILQTCRNPRQLVKRRTPLENAVLSANQLIENISKRVELV
nr:PREDICTED: pentatricopeptide repeat-containing protein At5g11310, mitochondrial-like [Nicotiana tabacum]